MYLQYAEGMPGMVTKGDGGFYIDEGKDEELKSFLSKCGVIAWGIVPTNEPDIRKETAEGLLKMLEKVWERLAGFGFDRSDIVVQSLITPACGLGSVSMDAATEVFRITRQISDHIRNSFDLSR